MQNLCAPDPDPQLKIEDVDRTKEQEDDLGISDMQTEGYEEQGAADLAEQKKKEAEEEELEKQDAEEAAKEAAK